VDEPEIDEPVVAARPAAAAPSKRVVVMAGGGGSSGVAEERKTNKSKPVDKEAAELAELEAMMAVR
jgi:hypothetical protein